MSKREGGKGVNKHNIYVGVLIALLAPLTAMAFDAARADPSVNGKDLAVIDSAADRKGSAASAAYFTSLFGSSIRNKYAPFGKYNLGADVTPPEEDLTFSADPGITFTGQGKLRLEKLTPFNIGPLFSEDLRYTAYGPEWNGYGNVFQTARHIKTNEHGARRSHICRGGGCGARKQSLG